MEAAAARPQLPALALQDATKVQRDEEAYQSKNTGVAPPTSTSSHPESTYSSYPPPPPYSHGPPQSTAQTTNAGQEQTTLPDSRRGSGEQEQAAGSVSGSASQLKQSLPSIMDVLGVESRAASYQTSVSSQAGPAPPPLQPLQPSLHKSVGSASPIPAMRSYAAEPPQPFAPTPKYQHAEAASSLHSDVRPALHVSTQPGTTYLPPHTAAQQPYGRPPSQSQPYDRGQGSQAHFVYGYQSYPARYQLGGPAKVAGGPIWQPSTSSAAPSYNASGRMDERNYGESVKRHLDLYDLEAALNDISATSSHLGDFAHRYSNLLHQSPRSGPSLSVLPSSTEIEDMIAKSRAQTEAILKIRETVMAQQAAHDQEAAESQQQKASSYDMMPPHSGDSDDGKSYSGADAKKRRGRAAPPGRCHSCNRAETPEWRRGPDGARTLCNACGLHYAKLTRKANAGGSKPGLPNSSSLRPKEQM